MGIQLIQTSPRSDIGWAAALGEFDDCTTIDKFGYNPDVGTGFETVWDGGGTYSYMSSADTLNVLTTAGTPGNDENVEVTIVGLDANWAEQTETVTLNASGTATTSNTFIRVYRAYISGTQAPTATLNIRDTSTTTNRAIITYDYNQTMMAVYTVPANKKAWIVAANISIEKQKEIVAKLMFRDNENSGVFLTKGIVGSFGVPYQRRWVVPQAVPAKTDIEIRAKAGASTAMAAGFEIILQDA